MPRENTTPAGCHHFLPLLGKKNARVSVSGQHYTNPGLKFSKDADITVLCRVDVTCDPPAGSLYGRKTSKSAVVETFISHPGVAVVAFHPLEFSFSSLLCNAILPQKYFSKRISIATMLRFLFQYLPFAGGHDLVCFVILRLFLGQRW